jgi:tetratricopeptide (TPR) repeat protein
LKARIYSVKHQNEEFEKEMKKLKPEILPNELLDFYYYIVATHYFNKKNFKLALKLIKMGLEFSENKEPRNLNKFIRYKLKNLEGINYAIKDKYDKAIDSFKETLKIGDELKIWEISKTGHEGILLNIATAYFLKGEFAEAIKILENLIKDIKDKKMGYQILRKLALCYLNLGYIEKAKSLLKKAIHKLELDKDKIEYYYIFIYMTMVEIYIAEKKFKEAKKYLELMKKLNKKYDFLDVKYHILLLESRFNIVTRNIEEADKIIKSMEKTTRASILAELDLYRAIISFAKSDNNNAEFYFNRALDTVPSNSYLENTIIGFYILFIYKTNPESVNLIFKNMINKKNFQYMLFFLKTESKFYPFELNPEPLICSVKEVIYQE